MNAVLNINVRVAAQQARQAIQQVQGSLQQLSKTGSRASGAGLGAAGGFLGAFDPSRLTAFGKNLQWTGRQLEFSFTLPLVLAGVAASKWALANENAMVQVRKVYGDGTESAKQLKDELGALAKSFELLSTRFGVDQAEVINIAGAWAQAGAAGVGLARATRLTLETMILGDMDAEKATQGLIAIQSAYALSTDQLRVVIADLNRIENQTGITLEGLIDTISRAGGTAKTAGIPIQQLAAYAAAIVPAAGSAAQAGNALRTIISRIMAPTKDTSDLLKQMGIDIFGAAWQSKNAVERIGMLATSFHDLSDAQKTVVSTAVASRWQLNRFDLLMEQIATNSGFYKRAMDTVSDSQENAGGKTKALSQMQKELMTALESNPKQLAMLWQSLKNALAEAIQPMIPWVINFVGKLAGIVKSFQNLSPQLKSAIAGFLVFLVVLGPITRYLGAIFVLIGDLGGAFKFLWGHLIGTSEQLGIFSRIWTATWGGLVSITKAILVQLAVLIDSTMIRIRTSWLANSLLARIWTTIWSAIVAVMGPIGSALVTAVGAVGEAMNVVWAATMAQMALTPGEMIVLIIGMFVLFIAWIEEHVSGGLGRVVKDIGNIFAQLPRIIGSAFVAVYRVIAAAIQKIVSALFDLSPFTRHSPSLVDEVIAGVDVILQNYERLKQIPNMLRSSLKALENFKSAAGNQSQDFEFQKKRSDIVAISPNAGPAVDALYSQIKLLTPELEKINTEIRAQSAIVDDWKNKLDAANDTLKASQRELDRLQKIASTANTALDDARTELQRLKDIPLTGWHAMDDAIFNNSMAVNDLRLQIMKMEDAGGGSIDNLTSKLSSLQGEIEMLKGESASLRQVGAGSDVLGPMQDQVNLLEQQRVEIQKQAAPINDLQAQLAKLQRQGEELDLEKSLKFDALNRQIAQVGQSMDEMPFDTLYAKVVAQQAVVDQLDAAWQAANEAVKNQQAIVDAQTTARDALQNSYDAEKDKLDKLKDAYSAVQDAIQEMQSALDDAASSASSMLQAMKDNASQSEKLFNAGAGYNFPDVGGTTGIGREGGLLDINAFNKQLQDELDKALKDINIKLDLFKPIKDKFKEAWEWIKKNSTKLILGALAGIAGAILLGLTGIPALIFVAIMAGLTAIFGDKIGQFFKDKFMAVVHAVQWVVERVVGFFQWLWDKLVGHSIIPDMIEDIVMWFAKLPLMLLDILGDAGKWLLEVGADILVGLFKGILEGAKLVWNFYADLYGTILGYFATAVSWLWQKGKDILSGMFNGIIEGARLVWDFYFNLYGKILGYFATAISWLWNKGKDILTGMWNGITEGAKVVWNFFVNLGATIVDKVGNALGWLAGKGADVLTGLWNGINSLIDWLKTQVGTLPGKIVTGFGNALKVLENVGGDIVRGLWNGIFALKDWIINKVSGFITDVIPGPIRKVLNVLSPSKVTMDIGMNVARGLAIGMLNQTDAVTAAATQLANAAIPQMSDLQLPNAILGDLTWRAGLTGATSGSTPAYSSISTSSSKQEIHFHGNLEFPNITSGDDAEAFIRNLEALA